MSREHLLDQGREIERTARYPEGKPIDGSPYTCYPEALDFLIAAVKELGLDKVEKTALEHSGSICGNHLLWAVFRELGIPCEE